ncbi:MAG: Fic family protein [Micrococcales bacterium]|nr:Fic family protein [Micrococcales bacterium]
MGGLAPIAGFDTFLDREYRHFAFIPKPLPNHVELASRTVKVIAEAERSLGRLDAATGRLPNPNLLVRPSLYREAVSTSALEGTYAPLDSVMEAEYVQEKDRTEEEREILNYVKAAQRGLELLDTKPICLTLIAELQAILVQGTRGDSNDAGRLRERQVYIGEKRLGIEESRFVPPPPGDLLRAGMSEWEKWLNLDPSTDDTPLIAKAAIGHYQFETLHPFSDGNGRLGRLIVVLQLVDAGALTHPVLNLSPWLEPRKDLYKDLLLSTTRSGEFDPWVQFFAEAVKDQAEDSLRRIDTLIDIRNSMLDALHATRAKGVILQIARDLIGYPVISPSQAASLHGVTYPPANAALQRLEELGYVQEITGRNYGRLYACSAVLRVLRSGVE